MNKIFLSKDNTSNLYKEILKENKLLLQGGRDWKGGLWEIN